jgi:hypothetical protein
VIAALGMMAWTTLRNPDSAPIAHGERSARTRAGRRARAASGCLPCSRSRPRPITPGGWDDAARAFCGSAWWRDPGFVDMRQSMTSGPDGRTCYYVTRSPPDRSPEAPSIQCVARRRDAAA